MGFQKQTVKDIKLAGKRVLLRADYNLPIKDGKITNDYRLQQSLPTLQYLIDQKASVVICSHLGRPFGPDDASVSLRPVAERLSKLIGRHVQFIPDCVGDVAEIAARNLKPGQLLMVENLRYHPEEEANDKDFAKKLAGLGEVFVQDGFGVVHRAHASTDAVTKYLPSVAGLLLEREVSAITDVMEQPQRPLMTIIGGAKISDKIDVLERFIKIADFVAVGGAMANTFLMAQGIEVGKSLVDEGDLPLAREIIDLAHERSKKDRFIFYLPQDGVVSSKIDKASPTRIVDWDAHVIADIQNYPKRPPRSSSRINSNEMILDIGPFSASFIAGGMQLASSVIWNGAMGVTETPSLQGPVGPYSHGTDVVVDSLLGKFGHKPFTVVGGGDTVGYLESQGLVDQFGHVSTGGGASLELMSGKKLPGVQALLAKPSKRSAKK